MEYNYLHYDVFHHELLRESRNDTLISRYTLRSQRIQTNYAVTNYSVFAEWTRSVYTIADAFQNSYINMQPRPVSHAFKFKLQTHKKEWLIQPEIGYAFSGFSDTLFIRKFPSSETYALNNYFFDLLPATFGDTLPYQYNVNRFQGACLSSKTFNNRKLYLYLQYSRTWNHVSEFHVNTSEFDALSGPRESLLTQLSSSWHIQSGLQLNETSLFRVGYQYHRFPLSWNHTVFPDDPDTIEIVNLAEGITHYHALQLGYQLLSAPFHLQLHTAAGIAQGNISASTPVLGYVFRILPISHQGEVIGRMHYLLGHLYLDYPIQSGKWMFTPRLDLLAARSWSDITIDAQLEFGLADIHQEQEYIHAAYIASLGLKTDIFLSENLYFTMNMDQLIPVIKTIYPEPPPPTPTDTKFYGGLSFSMGIYLTL